MIRATVGVAVFAASCGCPSDGPTPFELIDGTYSIEDPATGDLATAEVTIASDTVTIRYASEGSEVVVVYAIDSEVY